MRRPKFKRCKLDRQCNDNAEKCPMLDLLPNYRPTCCNRQFRFAHWSHHEKPACELDGSTSHASAVRPLASGDANIQRFLINSLSDCAPVRSRTVRKWASPRKSP